MGLNLAGCIDSGCSDQSHNGVTVLCGIDQGIPSGRGLARQATLMYGNVSGAHVRIDTMQVRSTRSTDRTVSGRAGMHHNMRARTSRASLTA